jgi:hypothetical protein
VGGRWVRVVRGLLEMEVRSYSALSNWSAMFAYMCVFGIATVLMVVACVGIERGPSTECPPPHVSAVCSPSLAASLTKSHLATLSSLLRLRNSL